ncbi:hypothetical protein [Nocardia terpenica]|uniref:hypothetical protein n=1 Tax=Nocardia terpenica TaxID=455432 RepID=UPI0012E84E15|nr:hypothetical protein [Nocardia terpenica]NQE91215.1 hypothetical protein [Nocardia terpenica]
MNRANYSDRQLLDEIRRVSLCDRVALDAATRVLTDSEKALLVSRLTKVAACIATCIDSGRSLPPPGTLSDAGSDHIELSAQRTALPTATLFLRRALQKWQWTDVRLQVERAVLDLVGAFVAVMEDARLSYPTRITLLLRIATSDRLVIEVHDSTENASIIAASGRLISDYVQRFSTRCGQYRHTERTVVWCEIARPYPRHTQ